MTLGYGEDVFKQIKILSHGTYNDVLLYEKGNQLVAVKFEKANLFGN